MRVIQVLPEINYGDAIGNNAIAIDKIMQEAGIDTEIYAERIDPRTSAMSTIKPFSELALLNKQDVLLYHFATYFGKDLRSFGGRLVFQYHNITPPNYFEPYDSGAVLGCKLGLQELKSYRDAPVACWAVSEYNKKDLIQAGFLCPIHVTPILVPFEDYKKPADNRVLEQYEDDYVNFLFVGRVVPNKAVEDVIRIFAWYQKHVRSRCRLFIVGNLNMTGYVDRLKRYVSALETKNVIFPGHITFQEILAYYRLANIFMCMSRHEGFCIPLLEAMFFQVPILALDSSAIPYTLAGAGALVEDADPVKNALLAERIITDKALKDKIVCRQNLRLEDFAYEKVRLQILEEVKQFL